MAADSVEAFLAREQQELAGIDDEFGALTTNDAVPSTNGADSRNGLNEQVIDVEPPTPENGFEKDEMLTNGENSHQFAAQTESAAVPNTLSALPLAQQTAMRQEAAPTPPPTREEPAKTRIWREQQKERLEKKDLKEKAEKKKLREQAKRELDEWYKNHREQVGKVMKRNRTLEQEQAAERDAAAPGQEWERVTRLCEFNPKSRAAKDLSRFRSILVQMKNHPDKSGK